MLIIVACVITLLTLGVLEKHKNEENIKSIPIRININGIRGKSTVTRLITSIVTEAGYKTIGKTTGTAARMIYWFQDEEKAIQRKIEGANINEQIKVIDEAAKSGAEALVCECMAVKPEYQEVFQKKMLKATICVIVNVLEDHLDVMGPTLDQVAMAFSETIPYNGHLITVDGPYREYFEKIAKERKTKVIIADNSKIPKGYLEKFDYVLFPENVSLAIAVAEALGISEEVALEGMLKAHPDPGAMRISDVGCGDFNCKFVNGFAANDPASTMSIWDKVCEGELNTKKPIVLINCRPDRVDRTEQFVNDVLPFIKESTIVAIGEGVEPIRNAYSKGKFKNVDSYIDLESKSTKEIMETLVPIMKDRVIFGIGNIHGAAEVLIDDLLGFDKELTINNVVA